jgi:hypothetical protein
LKQCAQLCIKLGLIEGNTLFVDGSKIRANASIDNTWTSEKCEKYLKNIDEHIENILKECEVADEKEQDKESMVKLSKELKNKEVLKSKIQNVLSELQKEQIKSMNSTDKDCAKVKGRQGIHAGYNSQIVVDEKHGLIVNSDVVNECNDRNQFSNQIEQANETLGNKCQNACADTGYANTDNLKKIDDQKINVIVPSEEQISKTETKPFDKERFQYDSQNDCYICPEGQRLPYGHYDKEKNCNVYKISRRAICRSCKHYGVCTTAKNGRSIKRLVNEELKKRLEANYEKEQSQAIFKLRKQKVELPFGHIKRNMGVSAFLLRGIDGVMAEMSLFASCFNITRVINIIGVKPLLAKLTV